jgi:hypothetical protein
MPSTASDDGLLAGGAVLLALVAVGVALLRDGGRRVINIPEGFGQSDESSAVDTTPDDLQSPEDDDWEYEDPSDNPDNSEDDLDFGNADPYEDGTAAPEGATTIPDSLADFDPAGRVDLVNQDEDDGGTWVGL